MNALLSCLKNPVLNLTKRNNFLYLPRLCPVTFSCPIQLSQQHRNYRILKGSLNPMRVIFTPARNKRMHRLIALPHLPIYIAQHCRVKLVLPICLPNHFVRGKRIWTNTEQCPPISSIHSRSEKCPFTILQLLLVVLKIDA